MILKDDLVQDIPTANGPMRTYFFRPAVQNTQFPGIVLYSEIFQMTGPIRRFATFLAGHGYLVAVPEVYHELEPAGTVLAYDQTGSDKGNYDKYAKELAAYDDDSRALLHHMATMPECNGRLGVVGICLGGHLAFRAAINPEVRAAVCFYATDIHSGTLGAGKKDDSLERASEIKGELLHIWGRQDPLSRSKDDGRSSLASTKLEPTTSGSRSTEPMLLCAMKVTATTQNWNIN